MRALPEDRVDNPLLTDQQLDIERRAARLLASPETVAVREAVAARWLDAVKPSPELRAVFDAEFEQVAFCSAMNAFNADPGHPRVHAFGRFAHLDGAMRVPGTKSGNPCPDYVYRFIPVSVEHRYVIEGRLPAQPAVAFEFGLIDAQQVYQGTVSAHELVIDRDGRFRITIDAEPASGRPNHIRSRPGACQVIVRDVLGDVAVHRPYHLRVERAGPGKAPAPRDEDTARRFGLELNKFVDDLAAAIGMSVARREPNRFDNPAFHGDGTFLVTQAYSSGQYRLADDEALVFTLRRGNAAYAVVPATNWWGGVGDFLKHTGTLGTGRAAPDPDGSYTFVLALTDPGVHNWIDPAGQHEGIVYVRWAGFDPGRAVTERPSLQARLVKLDDLPAALPPGSPGITTAARATHRERHRADYLAAMG